MVANVVIWRRRLSSLVARGTLTSEEAGCFIRGAVFWLVTPCLVLGFIALSAGWSDPFCGALLSFRDIPSAATSLVIVGLWVAMLGWVLLRRGADLLGRIAPALSTRPRYDRTISPGIMPLAVTGLILVTGVGAAIGWRHMPRSQSTPCALGRNAG
jgi:hypothetical protein